MSGSRERKTISRRRFVTGFSGAAAVLAAAPSVIAQSKGKEFRKSDRLVRIGVIGGRFGCEFQWHEHPHSQVTAVCDLRDDRIGQLKQTYRCDTAYKDYRQLIADKNVDAVGVFTPLPLHVPMAVAAMEAGKHVISAVAAGMNEQECVRLLETVKRTGTIYMMAETSYYRPEIITCRQWAAEKKFGEIIYSEAEYHHDGIEAYWFNDDGTLTWRHGLPPLHYPTHATGMVVPVTGERLVEVTAIGWGDGAEIILSGMKPAFLKPAMGTHRVSPFSAEWPPVGPSGASSSVPRCPTTCPGPTAPPPWPRGARKAQWSRINTWRAR